MRCAPLVPTLALLAAATAATAATAAEPTSGADPVAAPREADATISIVAETELNPAIAPVGVLGGALPVREVPATVHVVGADLWRDSGARTLEAILPYVPGVNPTDNGGGVQDALAIRGFTALNWYLDGRKSIGIYGVPMRVMPETLERIEILKGPAGAELGIGEPGGSVLLVSRRPERQSSGSAAVTVGEDEYRRFSGDVTGPVGRDGDLQMRLIAAYEEPPEWRNGRPEDAHRYVLAPALRLETDHAGTFDLSYQRAYDNSPQDRGIIYLEGAFPGGFAPRDWSFHQSTSQAQNAVDRLSLAHSATWTARLSTRVSVEYQKHLFQLREFRNADSEPGGPLYNADGVTWTGERRLPIFFDDWNIDTESIGLHVEADWSIDAAGDQIVTAGLRSMDQRAKGRYAYWQNANSIDILDPDNHQTPIITGTDGTYADRTGITEQGAFLRWRGDWSERLRTIASASFTDYDYGTVGAFEGVTDFESSYDSQTVAWRVGGSWDVVAGVAIFAGVSDGYVPQGGSMRSGEAVQPIHDQAVEAGVKAALGKTLLLTIAGYAMERSDLTANDPANSGAESFLINAGAARIMGVEAELVGQVGRWWDVRAGGALARSEITERPDQPDVVGNQFANTPRVQAATSIRHDWGWTDLDGVTTAVGCQLIGDRYGNAGNTITLPSYTLIDASIAWSFAPGSRLSIQATNLFDETAYTGMQDSGSVADQVMVAPRRNVSVTLAHAF
jgi:iron complex outermembrane recepter protein